eukprot:6274055-Pyramimonas_sp.AAC.1
MPGVRSQWAETPDRGIVSFRPRRARGRGEAARAREMNEPAVARAKSRQMIIPRSSVQRWPSRCPAVPRGAPWRPVVSAVAGAKSRHMILHRPSVWRRPSRCPAASRGALWRPPLLGQSPDQ